MSTLGIDLGTTHAVAAHAGQVLTLRGDPAGSAILPSVVALPPSGETLVGTLARARRAMDPRNTLRSTKRVIGEPWGSERVRRFCAAYGYDLQRNDAGEVGFRTRAGLMSAQDVATLIVATLMARTDVEPERTDVVVTVPAAFGDRHRQATCQAVQEVGFRSLRVIEEPVATALAYLERSNVHYAAVYDFGGGTFDVAIVDCTRRPFRIVGHAGDLFLGGDDIDHALAQWVAARILERSGWDLTDDPQIFDRLLVAAEAAKLTLSREATTHLEVLEVDPAAPAALGGITIGQQDLSDLMQPLLESSLLICQRALALADLEPSRIEAIFLAGGTTYLPPVRSAVETFFGHRPRTDVNPMHVVSIGASLAATRPALSELLAGPRPNG